MYKLAFRHKSAAQKLFNGIKISNERLEYLGDAVLGLVIADYLFKTFPYKDEGFLTEMRSKIVSRSQLNQLGNRLGYKKLIQVSQGGSIEKSNSILGNAFEAIIGAIYLDKEYEFTKKIIINHIIKLYFNIDELESVEHNFKSKLLEWSQKNKKSLTFKVVKKIPGFRQQYVVEALINNVKVGQGIDFTIKGAEQMAAEEACKKVIIENGKKDPSKNFRG